MLSIVRNVQLLSWSVQSGVEGRASSISACCSLQHFRAFWRGGRDSHRSTTHDVTASPSLKHASGFLSRLLQARNALFLSAQALAICLETAKSTEEAGTGVSASDIAQNR